MANEPERPIEKLLHAAAQKRRDEAGGPLELHPATRRLLQGEVARHYRKPQGESRPFWAFLSQLWPRLAWAGAILVVLGAVVWLVLPGANSEPSPARLARNEPARELAPPKPMAPPAPASRSLVPAPASQPPPPTATTAAFEDRSQSLRRSVEAQPAAGQKQLAKESLKEPPMNEAIDKRPSSASAPRMERKRTSEAEIAASSEAVAQPATPSSGAASGQRYGMVGGSAPRGSAPAAAAPPPAVALTAAPASAVAADETSKLKDGEAGRQTYALKAPADAPAANRVTMAPTTAGALGVSYAAPAKAERGFAVKQRFTQATTDQKAKLALSAGAKAARPVLASFQLEQSGSELRIVDSDGSVYSGYLQLANAARRTRGVQDRLYLATDAARSPKDAAEEKPAARLDTDQVSPQGFFFSVAGTNRSLHKQVVFTGNLLPATNANQPAQAGTNLGAVNNLEGFQTTSGQLQFVPLTNTRISGKVVVGNAKPVEVNAEPTRP